MDVIQQMLISPHFVTNILTCECAYNYSCRWFSRVFETLKRDLAATRKHLQLKLNWIKSVTVTSSPSICHFFPLDMSSRDYLYLEIEIFCDIDPHGCSFLSFQEGDQKMISSGIVAIYKRQRWENCADVESYRKCSFDKWRLGFKRVNFVYISAKEQNASNFRCRTLQVSAANAAILHVNFTVGTIYRHSSALIMLRNQ